MKFRIFVLILLGLITSGRLFAEDRQLVDRVAAVVNKEVITQSEFDTIFRPIYDQITKAYSGPDLQRELETIRLKLLNQLIEDRLVYQEAQKMGITVTDAEVQEELEVFKKQFKDPSQFGQELERAGMTTKELEKRIRERIAITKLHQSFIRAKVVISPSEVEAYYRDHPEEFIQKEQAKVWCITIRKSPEAIEKGTTDEPAKRKIGQLIAELKRGMDFGQLARTHSQDVYRDQNGLIGVVHKGDLTSNVDEIIFSLSDGGFSDIVETEQAYHIFQVKEKRLSAQKTFEEARDEIVDKLFRMRAHERFVAWMDEIKKKAYISIR